MAQLLPEQLEFDFFAPPAPEKLKQSENKAKSTAFKDTDILKFQLNKDGSRKLEDFGEDLNNTRKGRSRTTSDIDRFLELPESDLQKYLASEPLEKIWPKASIQALAHENPEAGLVSGLSGRSSETSVRAKIPLNTEGTWRPPRPPLTFTDKQQSESWLLKFRRQRLTVSMLSGTTISICQRLILNIGRCSDTTTSKMSLTFANTMTIG